MQARKSFDYQSGKIRIRLITILSYSYNFQNTIFYEETFYNSLEFQRQFANRSSPSSPSWKTAGDVENAPVHGKTEPDAESFEIREGTNIDEEALRRTWEYFCGPANVKTVHDLTAVGMRKSLQHAQEIMNLNCITVLMDSS